MRASAGREDRARLGERMGASNLERSGGRLAWLHGASVGESLALLPLVELLSGLHPQVEMLVTSGTTSSARILASRLPPGVKHQFIPVDLPRAVNGFLDHWRPDLGIFVESDLWPNLIHSAKARGTRLALVSARLSRRSLERWRLAPGLLRSLLTAFDLILARDQAVVEDLANFGIVVDGVADLKFAAVSLPADTKDLVRLRGGVAGRRVVVASSTHSGEEALIARAFTRIPLAERRKALLILAPRHSRRADLIAREIRRLGLTFVRRSRRQSLEGADVCLADEIGELGLWYRLADLAVLGGSLKPGAGGHNPIEPARLDCPIVHGPFIDNWPVYRQLDAFGAARIVHQAEDLTAIFAELIRDPSSLSSVALAARNFVEAKEAQTKDALGRVLEIAPW
ncbi:MAG: 3-deoxy-D-manno-octulosonic acid transferase [Caulobacteraceae bacterium]